MTTDRRSARHTFNLMELIVAASILGMVMAGAFSAIHLDVKAQRHHFQEHLAVKVLDNVSEHLAFRRQTGVQDVDRLLTREFQRSELSDRNGISARTRVEADKLVLEIRKTDSNLDHNLASIRIALDEN